MIRKNAGGTTATENHRMVSQWSEKARTAKEKLDRRNSRGNAEAECTAESVNEPRKMEDGHWKETIAINR